MNYRWSIWLADLEPVIGAEQGKKRPVLVISNEPINQLLPVVNILPITSRKEGRKIYPNEVLLAENKFGLDQQSIVLCYQIRTIDKSRLSKFIGELNDKAIQTEVIGALCLQLGINLK